jgi:hypothetical protein
MVSTPGTEQMAAQLKARHAIRQHWKSDARDLLIAHELVLDINDGAILQLVVAGGPGYGWDAVERPRRATSIRCAEDVRAAHSLHLSQVSLRKVTFTAA